MIELMNDVYWLLPHSTDEWILAICGNAIIILIGVLFTGIYIGIEKIGR